MSFKLLSPDSIQIEYGKTYRSQKAARLAFEAWAVRYRVQGYYRDARGKAIPVSELWDACRVVDVTKPAEVKEVERRLRANAAAAGCGAKRAYCHFVDNEGPVPEWRICDNWEQSPTCLIYREGKWFSRQCWDGSDKPYSYEQALGDAGCWFTG